MAIRILLANHQPIVRSGLRLLLEREADFQVVAEAADGKEAMVLAEYKRPAVTLLEIKLPKVKGIAVAKEILSMSHLHRVIFVSDLTDVGYAIEAFKTGAHGYVGADSAPTDLVAAVREVAAGHCFVSPSIRRKLLVEALDLDVLPKNLWQHLKNQANAPA